MHIKITGIKTKKKSTKNRQWAEKTVNLISGCAHSCKYCYAKAMLVQLKINTIDNWKNEVIRNPYLLKKKFRKRDYLIMFPSTHDITPEHLQENLTFLGHLLAAGNKVLIVSKPHLECVKSMCDAFIPFKGNILFRFTIGSADSNILKFWEPNAPDFNERLESLKYAFNSGYQTSVSCEPMLDDKIDQVIQQALPYVTETIWIGIPNLLIERLSKNGFEDDHITMDQACALMKLFSDEYILSLYAKYQNNPKIMWKSSIKKIIEKRNLQSENDNLRTQVLSNYKSVVGKDSFILADDFKSIKRNL
jgi:DNA repair photolyase